MTMNLLISGVKQEYQRLQSPKNRPRYFMFGKKSEIIHDDYYSATFENVPESVVRNSTWSENKKVYYKIGDIIAEGKVEVVQDGVKVCLDKNIYKLIEPKELITLTDIGIEYILDSRELMYHLLLFLDKYQNINNDYLTLLTEESSSCSIDPICNIQTFKDLNKSQNAAINKALTQKILFIWGPPGTGKTKTMAALAACLIKNGKRVLLSALSNMALDQLLLTTLNRLENLSIKTSVVRLGSTMDENCYSYSKQFYYDSSGGYSVRRKEKWDQHINTALLVAANFATLTLPKSSLRSKFDCVIVDEASMVSIPTLVASSYFASKSMVIGGDPFQLPPIFPEDAEKPNEWFSKNVFDRVGIHDYYDIRAAFLEEQYRMDSTIGNLVSNVFYKGQLKNGVSNRNKINLFKDKVVFFNISGKTSQIGEKISKDNEHFRVNSAHADAITLLVMKMINAGVKSSDIGIITPYNAQVVNILRKLSEEAQSNNMKLQGLKVSTIHSFQGQERRIIIFDITDDDIIPTRLTAKSELINVAISRAQDQLIIVGNKRYLRSTSYFSPEEREMFNQIIFMSKVKKGRCGSAI